MDDKDLPSLTDYFAACERFDWYYCFSDDGRVYRAGAAIEDTLRAIATASALHFVIFDAWQRHMFSGPSWNTERAPRPVPPVQVLP